jgi:filamentous hemagglutinin family protein
MTATVTLLSDPAVAGPVGQQVVVGDVTFTQNGSQWVITASDGSIIDYLSFDIFSGESVQFIQPGEFARVLNRINSAEPTQIMGTLSANGVIYFVNPSGVIFGAGATVDVAGIVAAAGNITNADFLAGNDMFTGLSGTVDNKGAITADGGRVAMLGQRVLNSGSITANGGMIAMVAGDSVWLRTIDGRMAVRVDGRDITGQAVPWAGTLTGNGTAVENTGTITASAGQVVLGAGDVAGLAVRNAGSIIAPGGEVTMAATQGVIRNEGLVDVSGPTGGRVVVQAPAVENLGTIKADGTVVRAGTIELMGRRYTVLYPNSLVSARGIGGTADGGSITVNSLQGTSFLANDATIDVRGADAGGNGGDIAFGGMGMALAGDIKLGAGNAAVPGTFMFLGDVVDVGLGGADTQYDALLLDGLTLEELDGIGVNTITISTNTLQQAGGQLLIQASGDIFLVNDIQFVPANDVDLVLQANGDIRFEAFTLLGANSIAATADFNNDGVGGQISISMALSADESITLTGNLIRLNGANLSVTEPGGTIALNGTTEILSDLSLTADAVTMQGGASIGGANNLTVNANDVAINGDWTNLGTLDLSMADTTLGANITIEGNELVFGGGLTLQGDADLTGTQRIEIGDDIVVTADGLALRLNTEGQVELFGRISNGPFDLRKLGSLVVDGDIVFSRLNGNKIDTSGNQTYNGNVILLRDLVVSGAAIRFNGDINADVNPNDEEGFEIRAGLLVETTEGVTFNGQVGNNENGFLRRLQVDGEATLAANGLIRTRDDQQFNGAVTVTGIHELVSTDGGDITFGQTVGTVGEGEGNPTELTVNTSGTTRFGGNVTGLGRLETDAPGQTVLAGNSYSADVIEFGDVVELEGIAEAGDPDTVAITGNQRVSMLNGARGNGKSLSINAPVMTLTGGEQGFTGFENLSTGVGTTNIRGLFQAEQISVNGDVSLTGDTTFDATNTLVFQSSIDGPHALDITAGVQVTFGGNIGQNPFIGPLSALTVTVDANGEITDQNLIVFGPQANVVRVAGDLKLNSDRMVTGSQLVASIAALSGLTLDSQNGNVELGAGEKLTVLGNLFLNAENGTVTFTDLTVLNGLTVDAQEIVIRAREAGMYLAADGSMLEDNGTDIVVGGTVNLSTVPTVENLAEGVAAPVFATTAGAAFANLGDLQVVTVEGLSADALQLTPGGAAVLGGEGTIILDFGAPLVNDGGGDGGGGNGGGGVTPPAPAPDPDSEFEGTLAEFTGEELQRRRGEVVDVRVNRDAVAQETLQRLALLIRALRPEELRTLPEGRLITVDLADPAVLTGGPAPTSSARVSQDALQAAGRRIDALLGPAGDEAMAAETATEIRESLLRSWAMWRADEGAAGTPDEFRAWLQTAGPEHDATRYAIQGLQDIAVSIVSMGLTAGERDSAIRPLIRTVAPATLGEAFVTELVMGG